MPYFKQETLESSDCKKKVWMIKIYRNACCEFFEGSKQAILNAV
jgi:hypothetical protein